MAEPAPGVAVVAWAGSRRRRRSRRGGRCRIVGRAAAATRLGLVAQRVAQHTVTAWQRITVARTP
eukprot:6200922-Pleurochrysis_carterae.AAC.3